MNTSIQIGSRRVGAGEPTYIVAELSGNHNHDFSRAVALVRAAAEAGADAVKLQTYTADTLTIDCDREWFTIRGTQWGGRTLYDLYTEAHTPWEWHAPLQREAAALGLEFFSTPFDETAVDFLEDLGVPAYKIASFENGDLPLLRKVARTEKPTVISTGMASRSEIDEALSTLRSAGGRDIVLLKCTSAYPSPPEAMNLRTIPDLARTTGVPVGLSDHTIGHTAAVAAVTLGACLVEKHLTLRRADGGPDAAFSAEPQEFRELVNAIRTAERALGTVSYGAGAAEAASVVFRRSLFVVEDVYEGETFTARNIRSIRPGYGLPVRELERVLGRSAACAIPRGTPLAWEHVRGGASVTADDHR